MKTSIKMIFSPAEIKELYFKTKDIGIFEPENEDLHSGLKKLFFAYEDAVAPNMLTIDMLVSDTTPDDIKYVWVKMTYQDTTLVIRYDRPKHQQWSWGEGANELLPEHVRAYWHSHADEILDELHAGKNTVNLFIPNIN